MFASSQAAIGFSKIYGTPHTYPGLYENTTKSIKNSFDKLKSVINDSLIIDYASEYLLNNKLIESANEKKLLTISDNFLLVEFNFINMPLDFHEIIFNLQTNDISIILAHPERYTFLHDDFNKYYTLKKLGVYFQLNLLSVVGYYGPKILKVSDKLLKNNMIDFVGSDVHNLNHIKNFSRKIKINEKEQFLNAIENNLNYFK